MAAPSEYVAEGDGFGSLLGPEDPIIRAAANGDIAEVRRQLSLGQSVAGAMYLPVCLNQVESVEAILEAGGTAEVNARASFGWTFLGLAASGGHVKLARVLLAAGADPDRRVTNRSYNHTPLQMALRHPPITPRRRERIIRLLVSAGATIPCDAEHPYLLKVRAAGGFRAYEKAHRARLAATLARVVFPRLPVDALSHVAAFAFHTGY